MTTLIINPPTDPLTPSNVTDLARDCHADSVSKGWWDPLDTPTQEADREAMRADLIGSEVGEALDALRRPERPLAYLDDKGKPDGYLIEVADVAIRALDLLGRLDHIYGGSVDLETRTTDGNRAAFLLRGRRWQHAVWSNVILLSGFGGPEVDANRLACIVYLCEIETARHNADLLHLITLKRDFNRTRPTRHGGLSV